MRREQQAAAVVPDSRETSAFVPNSSARAGEWGCFEARYARPAIGPATPAVANVVIIITICVALATRPDGQNRLAAARAAPFDSQRLATLVDQYIIVLKHQHYQWFMSAPGVRRNRLPLGLTLEQLAERSGLTPNYIGTVENGRRDPSLSTVMSLATGLGVPAGELVGGVAELGPVGMETARLMEAAPPELQDAILELAKAYRSGKAPGG